MSQSSGEWRIKLGEEWLYKLETDILPSWMCDRRWFQAKSHGIRKVSLVDGMILWSIDGLLLVKSLARVESKDGTDALYQIPLALSRDHVVPLSESACIGRLDRDDGTWTVIDGLSIASVVRWYLNQITGHVAGTTVNSGYFALATSSLAELMGAEIPEPIRLSEAEQSHSNVILGDRLLLKVFRKLDSGPNPDIEVCQFLTERTAFRNVPRLAGSVTYRDSGGRPYVLAMLQEFVPSRGQGWEWMLGQIGQAFEQAIEQNSGAACDPLQALGSVIEDARLLGRRTAELHRALAGVQDDPEFRPEPFQAEDWRAGRLELHAQVERTWASLLNSSEASASLRAEADAVLFAIGTWLTNQDSDELPEGVGQKIRIHGDYHLGQTLRTETDYYLLDFEGEPSKPIEFRRRKQSPLRDVAGMIRSFDYAVFAAYDRACQARPDQADLYQHMARKFRQTLIQEFDLSYLQHTEGMDWSPQGAGRAALLSRLLLEKAIYELDYELNNRPGWATIPLRGLRELVTPKR